ncbi:MAG: GAF domain-containing protein [Deltaproteobacteria bacterium]|nr:MAG: GAF domain-containing protein [Deltaproteobacteria bacterium]
MAGSPYGPHPSSARDETLPALTVHARTRARRRRMLAGALAVLGYAAAVLIGAATSPDLGFYAHQGGPILAVDADSAAARAGVAVGQRIVGVGGVPLRGRRAVHDAIGRVRPGDVLVLDLDDGTRRTTARFVVGRRMPWASAAAVLLASVLLWMAVLADRGGPGVLPRAFFRSTLVYVVFLAGAFSWEYVASTAIFSVPWFFAMALAAPVTCHFMLKFPAGAIRQTRRQVLALYAPPIALATAMSAAHLAMYAGIDEVESNVVALAFGAASIGLAVVYLVVGVVSRAHRLRHRRAEVDPGAARWLQVGHAFVAVPLIAGGIWAWIDVGAFVAGGFKPFIGVAMIGGTTSVVLAMTRTPFGELDRMWRRSGGHVIATALAGALFLAFIGAAGGAASTLSGGNFTASLGATLVAAALFGPVRARLQQMVDARFARDRSRIRALLREAAEAAAATLDLDALLGGVVHRVRDALSADGAAIFEADDHVGGWRRVAVAGTVPIGDVLAPRDPISLRLRAAFAARSTRELAARILGVPLAVDGGQIALVVAPRDDRNGFDDEERELLQTVAAQLAVAINNARAHTELHRLNDKLRREYARAEKRRRQIARLKERVEEENRELLGQLASRDGRQPVIGSGLRATFELVQKVARTNATALVLGETGVGKELIARAIHAGSRRRGGPFVVVDCGAISPGLFESALFGHERGAFTGAVRSQPGAFRSADGGTVFLDEIGELPLDLQPKLLRVLQEREVHPVGADQPVPVDVRVVAGTNRNLREEVARGAFREDLLYRLQVVEIHVPPLRDRRDDIPALADYFLEGIAQRTGRPKKRLDPAAMDALRDYPWPGNVRELEHAMEAAVVYAEGDVIRASDLPIFDDVFRARGQRALAAAAGPQAGGPRHGLRETLEELERQRLIDALREHDGNRTRAAKALGISRGALLRRLKRYAIEDAAAG